MVTSFTRIVVVLSLLRTAMGLQTAPPNSVMVSLALFLTFFIMQPTLQASYDQGVAPLLAGQIQFQEAFDRGSVPLHCTGTNCRSHFIIHAAIAKVRPASYDLSLTATGAGGGTDQVVVPVTVH